MIGTLAFAAFLVCTPTPTCGPSVPPPCATPTPMIGWDQVADTDLDGYDILYRLSGDTVWTTLVTVPCQRWIDDWGTTIRFCRAADMPLPLQRYPELIPGNVYDICVKAYDTAGNRSVDCSNIITVCMPQVWDGPPNPYN